MPTITTQTLVDRARAAADMHDNFVTDAEWMSWATQERMALDLLLARSGWVQDYDTVTYTVTGTENGVFDFGLTSVMAVIGVWESGTAGVRRLQLEDSVNFFRQLNGSTIAVGHPKSYRVKANNDALSFNFWPTPSTGTVLVALYIDHPATLSLSGGTTSVIYPMGWEERIVLGMARKALEKEESDSTPILRRMKEMESQIEELCWSRVTAEAPSVRNVDLDTRGWTDRFVFPPWQQWAWL